MTAPTYLHPDTTLTLREALAELHALEGDVTPEVVSAELTAALTAHDAVHVLFACDITDRDEVLAHLWMMAGTDASLKQLHAMTQDADHRRYARHFAHGRRLLTVIAALPAMVGVLTRAARMTKRWPFADYARYLDQPLTTLRAEFGIRVPHRTSPSIGKRGPHHPPVASVS